MRCFDSTGENLDYCHVSHVHDQIEQCLSNGSCLSRIMTVRRDSRVYSSFGVTSTPLICALTKPSIRQQANFLQAEKVGGGVGRPRRQVGPHSELQSLFLGRSLQCVLFSTLNHNRSKRVAET